MPWFRCWWRSRQNDRLEAQVAKLTTRVARQDERIATLERQLGRSSKNSSQPPSADSGHGAAAREGPERKADREDPQRPAEPQPGRSRRAPDGNGSRKPEPAEEA